MQEAWDSEEGCLVAQTVGEIMTPAPVAVRPGQPLTEAASVMRECGIGDVLVVEDGQLTGLVTDRDIVVRAVADGRDPAATTVGEICSPDLVTVEPGDDAETPCGGFGNTRCGGSPWWNMAARSGCCRSATWR
jgi:signal-transduction protein with cAMP-binding, CBS, and nucleotidyltransferase domain